ncbi:hypothetical protein [Methanoculleus chikugoensis]|uniref:hypothetical protein n=1 Tax=Methanoculleus chikugoensis TaxID=118126 RepID=UPI0006D169ED|nr:hypothetical protein [Methanoculleus chikugoensis]
MTHSPLLRSDQTLFRDPDVFEFTYLPPDHLHHRDAQVRELAFLLRPASGAGASSPPSSAARRGGPGRPPPSAGSSVRSPKRRNR